MSRLIDADALKDKAFGGRKGLVHSSDIDAAPTIDAIPMEWLRDKMRGYASSLKSTETAALVMVMQMWQKEQEAQDG